MEDSSSTTTAINQEEGLATSNHSTLSNPATLRALGFCGVDDSIHPNLLCLISHHYPLVEFGVLFRPDKEGQPRYPTAEWVERLSHVAATIQTNATIPMMKLAAHLCGSRVNQVLRGDSSFISTVQTWGFQRIQINATAVNGVDTSRLKESVPTFLELVHQFPTIEFILQQNEETKPLWEGLLMAENGGVVPSNVSMLADESKGTGIAASSWPSSDGTYAMGYAGGIGPHNIRDALPQIQRAATGNGTNNTTFWIDMESSLRSSKNGKDVFDLDKCYQVIMAVCDVGMMQHPEFLSSPLSP